MINKHIIADFCRLADYHTHTVVDKKPSADRRTGVNINTGQKPHHKRDKARIVPTSIYALNALGLSTQIPMNVVFLTDGAARKIKIGNGQSIVFKRTVAKNLSYKNDVLMLIVAALKEIGEGKVTSEHLTKIKDLISKEKREDIIADLPLAPAWIKKLILSVV